MDNSWVGHIKDVPLIKRYAQFSEEAIFDYIFEHIGTTNKYLVDFGAGGLGSDLSNSRYLLEQGWEGLRMDGNPSPLDEGVKKEYITAENICSLFEKYKVPKEFDFLSIDIDNNDFWVLKSLLEGGYSPRFIMNEFNGTIPVGVNKVMKYNPNQVWENNDYYGGSWTAFEILGTEKEYSLIYQIAATNMFFVRDDILGGHYEFGVSYIPAQYHAHSPNREWVSYESI